MAAAMASANLSARATMRGTKLQTGEAKVSIGRVSFVVEAKEKSSRERCRKRHLRIRNRVQGTADRPRLAVFRSNNHIYCQVIDDVAQRTLAAANTMQAHVKQKVDFGGNVEAATAVGAAVAEACKKVDVTKVVFDRGGNLYHGRIKALADAAREGGLEF